MPQQMNPIRWLSGYDPAVCSGAESVVNDAIEYISSHLSGEISLDLAAVRLE